MTQGRLNYLGFPVNKYKMPGWIQDQGLMRKKKDLIFKSDP